MIYHAITTLIMALVAYGAHIAMQEGMILHPLAKLFAHAPTWAHKPLFACPPCMCSAWGVPVWFAITPDPLHSLAYLPIHILAAAGIAAYLNR